MFGGYIKRTKLNILANCHRHPVVLIVIFWPCLFISRRVALLSLHCGKVWGWSSMPSLLRTSRTPSQPGRPCWSWRRIKSGSTTQNPLEWRGDGSWLIGNYFKNKVLTPLIWTAFFLNTCFFFKYKVYSELSYKCLFNRPSTPILSEDESHEAV